MTPDPGIGEQSSGLAEYERLTSVTPQMDRYNGRLYLLCYMLIFLSGPVDYVGVVQASLCDKLGTSYIVANLPTATYALGYIIPFLLSSRIPYRFERAVVVIANLITAASMCIVCITLFFPFGATGRIAAVILQGVIMGFSACTSDVYMLQCLGRGTTEKGRAWAFKFAFTLGPIMGIVGSLGTQFVLNGGIHRLRFPYDFGFVYLLCIPSMAGVALLSSRYKMIWIKELPERPPFFRSVIKNVKSYATNRNLILLWFAYLCWYFSLSGAPNLALYSQQAVGRSPATLAGLSMALRFGGKSVGGFILGVVATRFGSFAPSKLAIILVGGALAWAWIAPGYSYLCAFMLIGAAELGGAYIPNSVLTLSSPEAGARNIALLALAGPASSIASVIHGAFADLLGFHASFALGITTALVGLWLISRVGPARSVTIEEESLR